MTVEDAVDVVAAYDRHFAVIRADTPELLDQVYRLRYRVYCVENQFEDPGQCRDGREIDDDDDRSIHALLVHRRSGAAAGTARVILPLLGDMRRPLPIQRIIGSPDRLGFQHLPLHRTAEVSRFAVSKAFRRRQGEARYADAGISQLAEGPAIGERRLAPYVTFGLLRGVLGICLEYGITHLAAVMEPALVRIMIRLGLDFEPLGGLVEYHGRRQPCLARLADLILQSRNKGSPLWRYAGVEIASRKSVRLLPAIDA